MLLFTGQQTKLLPNPQRQSERTDESFLPSLLSPRVDPHDSHYEAAIKNVHTESAVLSGTWCHEGTEAGHFGHRHACLKMGTMKAVDVVLCDVLLHFTGLQDKIYNKNRKQRGICTGFSSKPEHYSTLLILPSKKTTTLAFCVTGNVGSFPCQYTVKSAACVSFMKFCY